MFILLLTFLGTYEWFPVEGGNVSKEVLESSIVRQFGKNRLRKSFIKLDADIFKGGCMALLPKGYKIKEVPEGLKLMVNYIEMKKYDRYSAIYESGDLEKEWNNLKKELAKKIELSYLRTPSLEALRERLVSAGFIDADSSSVASHSRKVQGVIEFPQKVYCSFLVIEKGYDRKLVPVLLVLSPVGQINKQIISGTREVGGGKNE